MPLYEAKLIHQFDHRWAKFVPDPAVSNDDWASRDIKLLEKTNPGYQVATRYWVDEREVLARIARVPTRVSNAWLAWHYATDAAQQDGSGSAERTVLSERQAALTLAVASWVAGALFRTEADRLGTAHTAQAPHALQAETNAATSTGSLFGVDEENQPLATAQQTEQATKLVAKSKVPTWSNATAWSATETTERLLANHHPLLADALKADGTTGKKALSLFQKWAVQDDPAQGLGLSGDELAQLQALRTPGTTSLALQWLDTFMDRRSPKWLMGWRNIARSTDESSFISAVMPRMAVGHSLPLWFFNQTPELTAAFLANMSALVFDYVVRQKLGGTNMTFGYYKQFPVLPPDYYKATDLAYIVPRVLELTHTAHDMQAWASDLLAAMPSADPRPHEQHGTPLPAFPWNPERRAQLRAELDATYARLYGLPRDELRYILDPAAVMGPDYPSETFRVLKNNEMREFGEYRTQRHVLAAWNALTVEP